MLVEVSPLVRVSVELSPDKVLSEICRRFVSAMGANFVISQIRFPDLMKPMNLYAADSGSRFQPTIGTETRSSVEWLSYMHSSRTSTFETSHGTAVVSQDTHCTTLCATSSATETARSTLVPSASDTGVGSAAGASFAVLTWS